MKTTKRFWIGVVIGILGVVLFSSKAVMVKLAYNYGIDPISVLLLRMLFAFPFYVVILYVDSKKRTTKPVGVKAYLWLVFFGFVGYYLASYFDFVGLGYIKASLERIILFLYPTMVLVLNKFFLKQPITKVQALAIALTYCGVVLAFWDELQITGKASLVGGAFIVLSALTYASYLVGSGWLIPKFGVLRFTAYAMLISCVCVFVHYSFMTTEDLFGFPWQVYVLGVFIAVFATVIPSFLVSASIQMISSSNFAIVAGVGPISTIILASIFLGESLTLLQFFGALVVIIGILIVSLNTKKKV
jgi:drug/metabolite transporter (DMT)-like permease